MLKFATLFMVLAIVAGVFGLAHIASGPGSGSRTVFFALLGLGAVFAALEVTQRRP